MDLQKFGIKLYLKTNGSFKPKDFIPVFHNWIQEKVVSDHMLIDVEDYSHILDGPGVMLIAHEGHFSLDQEKQKPGFMYMRRRDLTGNFKERFKQVLAIATQAANRLTKNGIIQEIYFSADSFRFIANDRRIAKNTLDNQGLYQDEVQMILEDMYPESKWEYEDVSDGNERLAFTVNFNSEINILDKK